MNRTSQPSFRSLDVCGRYAVFLLAFVWAFSGYACVCPRTERLFSVCAAAKRPRSTPTESRGQLGYIKPAALLASPAVKPYSALLWACTCSCPCSCMWELLSGRTETEWKKKKHKNVFSEREKNDITLKKRLNYASDLEQKLIPLRKRQQ